MPRRRKEPFPWAHKAEYTREEAVERAKDKDKEIRSGHKSDDPESRVNAYYDQYARCWRIGKLHKWEANHVARER